MRKTIYLLLGSVLFISGVYAQMIKEPNVAGQFYSADPKELSMHVDYLKEQASKVPLDRRVEVVVAPHAGYVYSGPVAGYAYKALARNSYKTVIVIAPSHFFPFKGIALWPQGAFKTPLGNVEVDSEFSNALLKENAQFQSLPQVFEREHALEVELPFIQRTFSDVRIVPILMGEPDLKVCEALAHALNKLIGSRTDVLLLVSSDMSHYHPYEDANKIDSGTLTAIGNIDPEKLFNGCMSGEMEMCGFVPMTTALMYVRERDIKHVEILKYANSGDTAGDKSRVVGYSAIIFYSELLKEQAPLEPGINPLSDKQKKQLLSIARSAIETFVKTKKVIDIQIQDPRLRDTEGAFVTIRKKGQLRGCIGNIVGQKPLAQTVRDMAVAAASQDPRFPALTEAELKDVDLEISVLSKPRQIKNASEIILGKHGVIVSDGSYHQGVFLPQVADETGWSKEEFLSQLCSQKAGLGSDAWKDPNIQLYTFTADVFEEHPHGS